MLKFIISSNNIKMYRANNDTSFVASKSISIKPESEIDYTPTVNQIRFLLPQYLGFVNPQATYLRYDLQLEGRGSFKPNYRAGSHSLLRDLRITTGDGASELEMISDYNMLTAMDWSYTSNRSINDTRSLFEGRSENADVNNQLYWTTPTPPLVGVYVTTPTPVKIGIQQPFNNSGILGLDSTIFPVSATAGLRLQLTLENFSRTCNADPDGSSDGVGAAEWYFINAPPALAAAGIVVGSFSKVAISDTFTIVISNLADATLPSSMNNPFRVNDIIYMKNATPVEEALGVVTAVSIIVNTGAAGGNHIVIQFCPNRAVGVGTLVAFATGDRVYWKQGDRSTAQNYTQIGTHSIGDVPKQSWRISNLELLTDQVQPPDGYIKSLMTQVQSDKGLNIDYRTNTTYRNNLLPTSGLTTQHINTRESRAYSLLTRPVLPSAQNDSNMPDAFLPLLDGIVNYQYVIHGSLVPDRPVDLRRLTVDSRGLENISEPLHTIEVDKALTNMGKTVRDVRTPGSNFVIGRGLSKYGQVYDLTDGDVALRCEYANGGGTEPKLFIHRVNHLNRLNISKNGSVVIR